MNLSKILTAVVLKLPKNKPTKIKYQQVITDQKKYNRYVCPILRELEKLERLKDDIDRHPESLKEIELTWLDQHSDRPFSIDVRGDPLE